MLAVSPPGPRVLELVRDPSSGSTAALARLAAPLRACGVHASAMLAHGGALAPLAAAGIDGHLVPFGDEPSWMAVNATAALIDTAAIDVLRAWPGSHALGALAAALTGRSCLAAPPLPALNMRELEAQRLVPGMHLAMPHEAAALAATLVPESTGRLIDPDRPDLLADAVRDLLDDGATRARMGASAREVVSRLHGVDAAAHHQAALFAKLAAPRRPERAARARSAAPASADR